MSKQSRRPGRAARHQVPPVGGPKPRRRRNALVGIAVAAVAVGLVVASTRVGGTTNASNRPLTVGQPAPSFSGTDVLTGDRVSSDRLAGRNILYFFNEGVMCQACLVQIQSLEQHVKHLAERKLTLVSVTNDDPSTLQQAGRDYGITTPLVADPGLELTKSFGALGGGMHANTADHTFILVDGAGVVRFARDYPSMWIEPQELLDTLPAV